MRRILYYSLLCLLWVSVNSCNDDEASQPPTPSFTVEPKTGLMADTEFTFTVDQVSAGTVSLLPYGQENVNDAGIIIPASSFTDGKATVKFKYGRVGTFNAVVVANNHSGDGASIKNAYSPGQAITITSDQAAITEFSFDGSTKTEIDADNRTVLVEMPWDKGQSIAAAKAKFALSPFASAKVGATAQTSESTPNNFGTVNPTGTVTSAPVVYTVTSENGQVSRDWTVTVKVKDIQTTNTVKSISGIVSDKGNIDGKVRAGRTMPGSIFSGAAAADPGLIVLYDTLGAPFADYDSIALDYALDGDLSYARFKTNNKKLKGKDTVNVDAPLTITITPQDSTGKAGGARKDYVIRKTDAPAIEVSFLSLIPTVVNDNEGNNFNVSMNVLNGTPVAAIATSLSFTEPADADPVLATDVKIGGAAYVPGMLVDYSKPVKVEVTVHKDAGYDFVATYTISVTVL